ncbi:MAG: AAA family ATPase [Proteobacteria bacterium]|nr:AAA family ATPase [Pseudomonadota bacterium]
MPSSKTTKHLVVDLKTGFAFGIKLDAEGNCKGAQQLNSVIETPEGRLVSKFGPTAAQDTVPYGQTTYAVELTKDGERGEIFTLVWPTKAEADQGAQPAVAKKELPDDLIKAGIAPAPKGKKAKKGEGVDNDVALKEALKNIDAMIGLDKAKHDIKQNIAVARFNQAKEDMGLSSKPISRHMVFTGNPGTGKTTFAREVAKVYHALGFIDKPTVLEVTREDLVAGYVGQTALKTKEVIEKAKGGILFIDEAYALSRDTGSDSKDFGREAIDTLVAAMENMREDLIVIVAGYSDPMKKFIDANPGLKSRFMTYIGFEDYSMPQLGEILDVMVKDRGYTMAPEVREAAMNLLEEEKRRAGMKEFGNGRTVRNLVEKAEKELAMRLESENKLGKSHGLSDEELKKALTTLTVEDIRKVSLDALGTKKPVYRGIDFDSAAAKIPANDRQLSAAAPPVVAKKPSLSLKP